VHGIATFNDRSIRSLKRVAECLLPIGKGMTDAAKAARAGQLAGKTAEQLAESASTTSATAIFFWWFCGQNCTAFSIERAHNHTSGT
jgi:hypothetical protein